MIILTSSRWELSIDDSSSRLSMYFDDNRTLLLGYSQDFVDQTKAILDRAHLKITDFVFSEMDHNLFHNPINDGRVARMTR